MATEKMAPGSASEEWAHAEAGGLGGQLPAPADANALGQQRHRCSHQSAVGIRNSTAERL